MSTWANSLTSRRVNRVGNFWGTPRATIAAIAVPALKTVLMLALTLANGPGGRYLMVGIDISDILLGLLGGLLFTLAWAMEEAAQVAEETRGVI